jgi:NhaA family Na+:H+ antiporter
VWRPFTLLHAFLRSATGGGFLLVAASIAALAWANSPWAPAYFALLDTHAGLAFGAYTLSETVLHWINDGLMALFFLLVGLEIKRELVLGALSTPRQAALPVLAALGGMIVPALIYVAVAYEGAGGAPDVLRGWAIPSATDIAFTLAALSLLGARVPASLKVFLAALAIIDDLGAIVIVAVFYTTDLHLLALSGTALVCVALLAMNRLGVTRLGPYLALGAVLWLLTLRSGVHATLAGVALALAIPLRTMADPDGLGAASPLARLERALQPAVAYAIVPVFGLANAGVAFAGLSPSALLDPVPLAIAAGLLVGKQTGVFGATWLAIRTGVASKPEGASWTMLYGMALLCGIGFTISLFVGALAFPHSPMLVAEAKLGVFSGSLLSALAGLTWLRLHGPSRPARSTRRPRAPARAVSR